MGWVSDSLRCLKVMRRQQEVVGVEGCAEMTDRKGHKRKEAARLSSQEYAGAVGFNLIYTRVDVGGGATEASSSTTYEPDVK